MVTLGIGGHQNLQGRCVQARPVRLTPLSGARAHPLHLTTGRTSRLNRPRFDYNSDSVARAAATDREAQPEAQEAEGAVSDAPVKDWIGLVANAEFMLHDVQNEALAEQLRERVRLFREKDREVDFWLVPEPVWLDQMFAERAKAVRRPCVALVSTDKTWMTFMKLRLDRVMVCELGPVSKDEALAVGGDVPEFGEFSKWTAPYSPYAKGWWKPFLPVQQSESTE